MKPKFDDTTVDLDARLFLAAENYDMEREKFGVNISIEELVERFKEVDYQPKEYLDKVRNRKDELKKEIFGV